MEWLITFVVTFITLVAGIVTIVWFIRDVRKENSKILKSIEEGQRQGFATLSQDLTKISEGIGRLGEMLANQTKILERIAAK